MNPTATLSLRLLAVLLLTSACNGVVEQAEFQLEDGLTGDEPADTEIAGNPASGGGGGTGTGTAGIVGSGLPCEVETLFKAQCTSCHGATLAGGAPMPLVTFEEVTAESPIYAGESYADRSLTRMLDPVRAMPPGRAPAAADVAPYQKWVEAGAPKTSCENGVSTPAVGTAG